MTNYLEFRQHIASSVEKFNEISKEEKIRVISHLDADGISACAILINALTTESRPHSISIVEQLDEDVIKKLAEEPYGVYIFSDIGAGQLNLINKYFSDKKIIIIDHHTPEGEVKDNMIYVNPHSFGIDGGIEISGAGVAYLFSVQLNKRNEKFAHLAVIGAMGDVQEEKGFKKLNQEILDKAIENGSIGVKKSIKLFGAHTRPLHKSLEYSNLLPNMNESDIMQFMHAVGINPVGKKGWKKMNDLTDEEIKALTAAIIMKRLDVKDPEDIFANHYTLNDGEEGTAFRDVKEFATLLNSCGRLNRASVGLGACLGDGDAKKKAKAVSEEYKRELGNALGWYRSNAKLIKGKNYVIINAEDRILHTIAGTLASIISKSKEYPEGTFVMCLARSRIVKDITKVSLRMSGNSDYDVRDVVKQITEKIGGQAGGHKSAAGALIGTDLEKKFIDTAKEIFESKVF